jgi:hypothetical protein
VSSYILGPGCCGRSTTGLGSPPPNTIELGLPGLTDLFLLARITISHYDGLLEMRLVQLLSICGTHPSPPFEHSRIACDDISRPCMLLVDLHHLDGPLLLRRSVAFFNSSTDAKILFKRVTRQAAMVFPTTL